MIFKDLVGINKKEKDKITAKPLSKNRLRRLFDRFGKFRG